MTDKINKLNNQVSTEMIKDDPCYYCEGRSNSDISIFEGEGGYKNEPKFRVICNKCLPHIQGQGGRSWSHHTKLN